MKIVLFQDSLGATNPVGPSILIPSKKFIMNLSNIFLLFVLISYIHCDETLTIHSPEELKRSYRTGFIDNFHPKEFNVSGYLIGANPLSACQVNQLKNANELRGKIVLVNGT